MTFYTCKMTSLEPKKMKLYALQIVFLGQQNNDFSKLTKCHLFLPKILQPKGSKMTSLSRKMTSSQPKNEVVRQSK